MPWNARSGSLALLAAVCAGSDMGCYPDPTAMSREEKRQRIEEMYAGYREDFPEVPGVNVEELEELRQKEDVVLVDVREPREIEVSRIPDAVPVDEFRENVEAHRDKKIVTYCTIGARSGEYAQELRKNGMDAVNLEGSILSWVHEGKPVVEPQGQETKRVHTYGKRWALAPEPYENVY